MHNFPTWVELMQKASPSCFVYYSCNIAIRKSWHERHLLLTGGRDFETDCREWLTWLAKTKWPDRTSFFRVLLSRFILLFLLFSSVSLSNFNHAVPMRKCLGKHSCMSSPFSIVILKELALFGHQCSFVVTCLLYKTKLQTTKKIGGRVLTQTGRLYIFLAPFHLIIKLK